MSAGASKATKALRARLAAARDALTAGDGQGARALTREALALDDTSYDAWVFDGKAAFACGDSRDALASYARAAKIRDDHPAARRGAVEAALGFQTSSPESTSEASSLVVHALRDALALPADAKQLTPARRVAWTAALAEACEAAGPRRARERWTALAVRGGFIGHARMHDSDDSRVSEDVDVQPEARSDDGLAMPDPNLVIRALEGAARCALAEEEASSRDEEDRAAEAVRSSTIASPAEIRAARAAARRRARRRPTRVRAAVRALLDAEARASAEDPVGAASRARRARSTRSWTRRRRGAQRRVSTWPPAPTPPVPPRSTPSARWSFSSRGAAPSPRRSGWRGTPRWRRRWLWTPAGTSKRKAGRRRAFSTRNRSR